MRSWALVWGVIAGSLAVSGVAQDRNVPMASNLGTMISVSGLKIPRKAWEHYEKARESEAMSDDRVFLQETDAALKVASNFAALYVLRASHEVHRGELQRGLTDVEKARAIEPGVAWSGVTLASAYNGMHRYVDAFLVLNALRAPEATTWQAAYEFTRSATGRADAEDALRWSAVTLKIAPETCLEAHLLRANALQLAHRQSEAAKELRAYLAAENPRRPHPQIEAVIALSEREDAGAASDVIALK